jgi:uncharacterized protein (DUF362 family)
VRTVLTIIDGVLAGEGEGPLAPSDVGLGAIIAGTDPVAVDLAAVRLMGFDETKIEKLAGPMRDEGPRITEVRSASDVEIGEVSSEGGGVSQCDLDAITAERPFEAHAGWIGHVERER